MARLIYMTTSGSQAHLSALRCFWTSRWTSAYDIHVYSNRRLSHAWNETVKRIPGRTHYIAVEPNTDRHQEGAIRAIIYARAHFASYEWVIRTNPDVHVVDSNAFTRWMSEPAVHAILANCNPDVRCTRSCPRALVHSDFQIFRPQHLQWNASSELAEEHATEMFRGAGSHVRWLQQLGYRDRSCRIRAGVREKRPTVVHHHGGSRCA